MQKKTRTKVMKARVHFNTTHNSYRKTGSNKRLMQKKSTKLENNISDEKTPRLFSLRML